MRNDKTKKLSISGICLALCVLLPMFIAQVPQIGVAISPMHIPVLLCAFLAGPFYAAAIGAVAPLLNFLLRGVPPIIPMGLTMVFELAAYGLVAGFMYLKLPDKAISVYVALIIAMFFGRVVWGIAMLLLLGLGGAGVFTWPMFIGGAVLNAIPGIILQIILIPAIMVALNRTGLVRFHREHAAEAGVEN